ncbi:MAG: hypothetical protein BGO30_00035 [Bacteroidetes bacterium 41-46]|jgi:hypothetical protein|nr:MAG: hypothetical protein BGO30_00035 [Bacteroidetes bacterium 41-46]
MKKGFQLFAALLFSAFILASCEQDNPTPNVSFEQKVLIINQGNFTEHSASLSLFDEKTMSITNRVYETANGISIGATIVSGTISPQKEAYLVCNNPDKIDIIDAASGKLKSTISASLASPRNMIFAGDKLFVTNWDYNYVVNDFGWWEYPDSYIAIYDAVTKAFIKRIPAGTDAEGIAMFGTRLFVAVKEGVRVFDASREDYPVIATIRPEGVTGNAKHLVFDGSYKLWASFPDKGLVRIDPVTLVADRIVAIPVDYMDGFITSDGKGKKIYTYITEFDANYNPSGASIFSLDVETLSVDEVLGGTYFYGVGVSPSTGNIFTAETSFSSNSLLKVAGPDGTLKTTAGAGIGTSRYLFF